MDDMFGKMNSRAALCAVAALLALPTTLASQTPPVTAEQLECIPLEGNSVVRATINDVAGGYSARLYFRRLNNLVEDFYYVTMRPSGGANWWAVLPRPEDHQLPEQRLGSQPPPDHPWAAWWKAKEASTDRDPNHDLDDDVIRERASEGQKEKRDWMIKLADDDLQKWLESIRDLNEPAEYYVAVIDSYGKVVAKSSMHAVPVRRDCTVRLNAVEVGESRNLTVGETRPWQQGEPIFHWLCEGVVTRIDDAGILRADEICRSCVVAWVKPNFLVPVASVLGATTIIVVPPAEPSPSRP